MRRRGKWVAVTSGECARHKGTLLITVHQRTADHPDKRANGHHHVMLDNEELVTVMVAGT